MSEQKRVVWKFPVPIPGTINQVPVGAEWLCVQEQYGQFVAWAVVDPYAPKESRWLKWIGTGDHVVSEGDQYIGTIQLHGGTLVLHLFDTGKEA